MFDLFRKGPDLSAGFGKTWTDPGNGCVWELVSQNDLNVPYFRRVYANGNKGKKTYTLLGGDAVARRLAGVKPL